MGKHGPFVTKLKYAAFSPKMARQSRCPGRAAEPADACRGSIARA
jgi:hypothetical protein